MSRPTCPQCDNGDPCDRSVSECPVQRQSALLAGIPADVIDGKKKLSDYYSRETIALMCGREMPSDPEFP